MRVAIVGCGQIADAHVHEIRRVPGATVEAVCDANPHMAEQASTRFGVPGVYTDLHRMLAEVKPDAALEKSPGRQIHLEAVEANGVAGRLGRHSAPLFW